ncbi:MAG: 16S rRNA methyltransferase [Promethearchaeota archaeon]
MPLILILVDCGLELIPNKIRTHPAVKNNINYKLYSSQLLDNAIHHSAMTNLKNFQKRGRPDIAHICILSALGSPLNKSGYLELYIHTANNKIFNIKPEIRISRNFNRFKGLIAKLLIDGQIKLTNNSSIIPFNGNLKDLTEKFNDAEIILFSRKGKLVKSYHDLFSADISKNYIVFIGGFQKGIFSNEVLKLSDNIISISKNSLDASIVVNRIITFYELVNNIV